MKEQFYETVERAQRALAGGEVLLATFSGERSDFVRFNRGRVRQAGSVEQGYVTLRLVRERRQASATFPISADLDGALGRLRGMLDGLPEDPWLLINEAPHDGETQRPGRLAPAEAVVAQAIDAARGSDLVGIYAGGSVVRGFASSLGQRNWHEVGSFNFDWSVYLRADKAVKASYAGFEWDEDAFGRKVRESAEHSKRLAAPEKTLEPGEYRAYLAPRALEEAMGMLSWGGFSARARQTRQSPLLRMQEGERLSPMVTLAENTAAGVAPAFQAEGFPKPARVALIDRGELRDALVSPRSAMEYSLRTNGASGAESPESLDMEAGSLEEADALAALGTGLHVSNLWYLNYSDRPAGRITGMTRFATFWVENGRIAAPIKPLRFDDSIYRILGTSVAGLTRQREMLLDATTYGERSTASMRLPGALLTALRFTL